MIPNTEAFRVGLGNATVALYRNGTKVNYASIPTNGAGQSVNITDPGPLQVGVTYTYKVTEDDAAGNISPFSGGLSITIQTPAPPAPVLDPNADSSNGQTQNPQVTNFNNSKGNPPLFDVSATGVPATSTVELFRTGPNGTVLVNTRIGPGTIADINANNGTIPDGTYTYTLDLVDQSLNHSPASQGLVVQILTVAPTPTLSLDPSTDSCASRTTTRPRSPARPSRSAT